MTALIAANARTASAMRVAAIAAFTLAATPLLAITIDGESRLTEAQFARKHGQSIAEVKKVFAASGTLECRAGRKRYRLTAQLTGQNDIIVTAAHAFIDIGTCRRVVRPEQCTFTTHDGRQRVTRAVHLVAIGDVRCEASSLKGAADWAVLKLKSPIPTIVPYDLGEWKGTVTDVGVLSVSAQSQDFHLNGARRSDVKTIDDCMVKRFLVWGLAARLATNCDVAPGNSGGALLARSSSGPHQLLGISVGTTVTHGARKSRNGPRDGAYHERTWSAHAVPLIGEFRAALERATGRPVSNATVFINSPAAPVIPAASGAAGSPLAPIIPLAPGESISPFDRKMGAFPPPVPRPCDEGVAAGECRGP